MNITERMKNILKDIKEDIDMTIISDQTDVILDLDFDSIDFLELISIIEDEFDIKIEGDNVLELMSNFGKMCNYIYEKSNKRS